MDLIFNHNKAVGITFPFALNTVYFSETLSGQDISVPTGVFSDKDIFR